MKIDVLPPYGFIELKKWSGDELDIVNAARVSFANESSYGRNSFGSVMLGQISEEDAGLINFLLREGHGTPFEQGMMAHWHIKCPIFVRSQWFKHRIGMSYNEVSARYTELEPEWYVPDKARKQTGKPGHYTFETIEDPVVEKKMQDIINAGAYQAFDRYKRMVKMGVAKEEARIILPQNMYTEFRWTTNARSLMNFLRLRNEETAQYEIRKYAEAIESEFARVMPNVHKSFVENGRMAP